MDLRKLLQDVKDGSTNIDDALSSLKNLPYEDIGYANIDHHREIRNGYPEVIYCEGKSDEHILGIIERMMEKGSNILGTRCRRETFEKIERVYDVGVAGIHRLLNKNHILQSARVVISVAGMEGALPSVVGGLVDVPVIAVPTSVGYGANFGGLSALLTMLNSCASGISVVNIDNGFGAGYLASMINKLD